MKLSTFNKDLLKVVKVFKVRKSIGEYFREPCPKCKQPMGEHEWDDLNKGYICEVKDE